MPDTSVVCGCQAVTVQPGNDQVLHGDCERDKFCQLAFFVSSVTPRGRYCIESIQILLLCISVFCLSSSTPKIRVHTLLYGRVKQ